MNTSLRLEIKEIQESWRGYGPPWSLKSIELIYTTYNSCYLGKLTSNLFASKRCSSSLQIEVENDDNEVGSNISNRLYTWDEDIITRVWSI